MCKKALCLTLFTVLFGAVAAQAAEFQWIRAAYWDSRYPTGWADAASTIVVRDGLKAAGYEILDADQLKTWMTARISDKKFSVVVFCRDIVPDTVAETNSTTCTLRKYLNAGGKIVWYADVPMYYQGHKDGTSVDWGTGGAQAILEVGGLVWDLNTTTKITEAGAKWGLTETWASPRSYPAASNNLTALATDAAGNAAAWVKFYKANDTFRGFIRLWDRGGHPAVADIIRVAEYVVLKATNPSPADGSIGATLPMVTWDASALAVRHEVYFGTDANPPKVWTVPAAPGMAYYFPPFGSLQSGKTYYWRVDEVEADGTVRTGDLWTFTMAPVTAFSPNPRNGDKFVDPNADLSWQPGMNASERKLYFGTDQALVTARDGSVAKGGTLYETRFELDTLAPQTTYYWVVDEVSDQAYPGTVWSFTTVGGPGGVKGEYFANTSRNIVGTPVLTRIDPSINFQWGETAPDAAVGIDYFSVRWTADLEISAADTYTFITTSDDGARLWLGDKLIVDTWIDQGTTDHFSVPLKLESGIYPLTMEYYEWGGGAVAQLSWQTPFVARQIIPAGPLQPPVRARVVFPKDGDVNVPQDVTLMWSGGEKAASHDVYLGTDAAAVAAATPADAAIYQGSQAKDVTSFTPGTLAWNTTYYWRVDEINPAEADSPWKGSVWSFTTANFLIVDNFESYTNDSPNRVFQTWIDGWGFSADDFFTTENPGNGSNSAVGHDIWTEGTRFTTIMETTIINSGGSLQAMPFDYNNAVDPYYSETDRTWASPQNWKVNGANTLVLYFRGNPVKFLETATGITMSAAGADIVNGTDEFRFAYKKLTGDGSISVKVDNVMTANSWTKAGVMIREHLDPLAMQTHMITAAQQSLTEWMYRAISNDTVTTQFNTPGGSTVLPVWVRLTRVGNVITGEYSTNGTSWSKITQADGTASTITLTMPNSVYIGIVVCSQLANVMAKADFSEIKTTGNVTGAWQTADVGVVHPGNDIDQLYVGVEDSSKKLVVVNHPDPQAVLNSAWTAWEIPLSQFTGVNTGAVKKMYIGVGNRTNHKPDGYGNLYFDDIRVIKK